jgi:hypothetical protein
MACITQTKIAFYGNKEDVLYLEKLTTGEEDNLFNGIIPVPDEILKKTEKRITKWKKTNWGAQWCTKKSSDIIHMENISIFRLDFISPHQPPYGVLEEIYKKFGFIKSISLTSYEGTGQILLIRKDPQRGFQEYLDCYPHDYFKYSEEDLSSISSGTDDFMIELSADTGLSQACEVMGISTPAFDKKI